MRDHYEGVIVTVNKNVVAAGVTIAASLVAIAISERMIRRLEHQRLEREGSGNTVMAFRMDRRLRDNAHLN